MFHGLTPLMEIHCPPELLEERERIRGNRRINQAHYQAMTRYTPWIYDLKLNSSEQNPEQLATRIMDHIRTQKSIGAFAENLELVASICGLRTC